MEGGHTLSERTRENRSLNDDSARHLDWRHRRKTDRRRIALNSARIEIATRHGR